MASIVVSDNVSLDGVIQDPAGDEGFPRGGWVGQIKDRPELARVTLDEALATEAMPMGRRTYEWFAGRWPSRTGPLADRLNGMPKYVVSSTLEHPDWNNTTVIDGDWLGEVAKLKHALAGEIVVVASIRIANTLIEEDPVDELSEGLPCRARCRGTPFRLDQRPAWIPPSRHPDPRRGHGIPPLCPRSRPRPPIDGRQGDRSIMTETQTDTRTSAPGGELDPRFSSPDATPTD